MTRLFPQDSDNKRGSNADVTATNTSPVATLADEVSTVSRTDVNMGIPDVSVTAFSLSQHSNNSCHGSQGVEVRDDNTFTQTRSRVINPSDPSNVEAASSLFHSSNRVAQTGNTAPVDSSIEGNAEQTEIKKSPLPNIPLQRSSRKRCPPPDDNTKDRSKRLLTSKKTNIVQQNVPAMTEAGHNPMGEEDADGTNFSEGHRDITSVDGDVDDDWDDHDYSVSDNDHNSLVKVSNQQGTTDDKSKIAYPEPVDFSGLRLFKKNMRKEFINQINADNPQAKLNLRFVLLGADIGMKPSMRGKKSYINDALYIIMVVARQLTMTVPELLSWHYMHRPKRNSWRVRLSTFFEIAKDRSADVRLCTLQNLMELAVIRVNSLLAGSNRFKLSGYKTIRIKDFQSQLSSRVSNWMIIAWNLGWLFQDGETWMTLPQSEFYCDLLRRGGVWTCSGAIEALDICMRVHHCVPPKPDVIQFWRREWHEGKDILKLMQQGIEEERSIYVEKLRNKLILPQHKKKREEEKEYGWRMKLEMIREMNMKNKEKTKRKNVERKQKAPISKKSNITLKNDADSSSTMDEECQESATIVGNTVRLNLNSHFSKQATHHDSVACGSDLERPINAGANTIDEQKTDSRIAPVPGVGSPTANDLTVDNPVDKNVGVVTPGATVRHETRSTYQDEYDQAEEEESKRYSYTDMSLPSYHILDLQPSSIVMINGRLFAPLPTDSEEDTCFIDSPPMDFSTTVNPVLNKIIEEQKDSQFKLVDPDIFQKFSPALHIKEYFATPGISSVYEVMAISRLEIYGRANFHKDQHWMECGSIQNTPDLLSTHAKSSFRYIPMYKSIDSSHKFFVLRETNSILLHTLRAQGPISYESIIAFVKEYSQNSVSRDGTLCTSNGWRFDFGTSVQSCTQIPGTGYWRPTYDFNVKILEKYNDERLIPSLAAIMDTIQICTDQVYQKTRQQPLMMDVDRDNFFGGMLRKRLGSKESRFETYSIQLKSMTKSHTTNPHKDKHNCHRWPMTVSFSIGLEDSTTQDVLRLNVIAYNRHKAREFTEKWRDVEKIVPFIEKYEKQWMDLFLSKCEKHCYDMDLLQGTNCHNVQQIYLDSDLHFELFFIGTLSWRIIRLPACSTRDIWLSAPADCIRLVLSRLINQSLIFELYLIALDQSSWFWFWKICRELVNRLTFFEEEPCELFLLYISICKEMNAPLTGGPCARFRSVSPKHLEELSQDTKRIKSEAAMLQKGLSVANLGSIHDYESWLNTYIVDPIDGVGLFRSQIFLPLCALSGMTNASGTLAATKAVLCDGRASTSLLENLDVDIERSMEYMKGVSKFLGNKYFNHATMENIFCESFRSRSPMDILFEGQSLYLIEFTSSNDCKVVEKPYGKKEWTNATFTFISVN